MAEPVLTEREQQVLLLAWQLGRDHALQRVAEAADDTGRVPPPPHMPYEQRVAQRVALFEACAAEGHARRGTREWLGAGRGWAVTS